MSRFIAPIASAQAGAENRELVGASRTSSSRTRRPTLNRSYIIPVLSKTITIIRLLEGSKGPLKISEIAACTGISKSTVYRILRTLSAHGLLPQGSNGIYTFHFADPDRA